MSARARNRSFPFRRPSHSLRALQPVFYIRQAVFPPRRRAQPQANSSQHMPPPRRADLSPYPAEICLLYISRKVLRRRLSRRRESLSCDTSRNNSLSPRGFSLSPLLRAPPLLSAEICARVPHPFLYTCGIPSALSRRLSEFLRAKAMV